MDPEASADWFWSMVDHSRGPNSCWPWIGGRSARGYGTLKFELCGERRAYGAHVAAYVLTNGGAPTSKKNRTTILHACDNPPCCNPAHLSFGSVSDNSRDSLRKGRRSHVKYARGEQVSISKLTEDQVREVRQRHARGESQYALAAAFGVVPNAIFMIVHRFTWRHVQ